MDEVETINRNDIIRFIEVVTGEPNPENSIWKAWEDLNETSERKKEIRRQFIASFKDNDSADDCEGNLPVEPNRPIKPLNLNGGKRFNNLPLTD